MRTGPVEAARWLERARAGDETAFERVVGPLRGPLRVHCYRIMGSVQDAEDLTQETLLAAWRGLPSFEGRSSIRSWLYRIATNRCLNAMRDRSRAAPGPGSPPETPGAPPAPTRVREPLLIEPLPDHLLDGIPGAELAEPHARYELRESIGLAFVAALQRLPPRQRAILVLRDALGFRAGEVAGMLEASEAAVTSALARARAAMAAEGVEAAGRHAGSPYLDAARERELATAFTDAFEARDIEAIVRLLTHDATLTMPPEPFEFEGPELIGRFFATVPAGGRLERFRLVATRANRQPAVACFLRDPQAQVARAYGLMVLTVRADGISAITGFPDTSLFASFGLPRSLPL